MDARRGFRFRGSNEVDPGAGSDCTRPFHVKIGFGLQTVYPGIWTIEDYVRRGKIQWQTKDVAEVDDVLRIDVALADDGDSLPGAVNFG